MEKFIVDVSKKQLTWEGNHFLSSLPMILLIILFVVSSGISFGQNPDRKKPPELGPPPSLILPPIQRLKLSNGLPVILMEKHNVPLVQMEFVVNTGSVMETPEKIGLASFAASMMEEGAGSRNALELSDAIDYLGASISTYAGQHTSGVVLHCALSKLDSALSLFGDIVMRPTFPADEMERGRKERLTTLMQWHDEPRQIASVLFNRALFGKIHPYGIPWIGDEKSLRAFRVGDLKKFHETYFHPNNASLIVVGDVASEFILPKLEALFGKLKRVDIPKISLPPIEQVQKRQIYLVNKLGAAQSEIRIGRIGVQRLTEDYYALQVLNTILGGSFTSRLNQNLREKHGYAYGAGSSFDFRPLPGPFVARASVQTDVTDKALVEFMKELTNILEPVTDDELMRAKNYLALGFPDNFQSVAQIARNLVDLVVYDLPDNFFNDYIRQILSITKEDVRRAAKKYLDPEKVAIIIVGDQKVIEKGIGDLNLAPMQVLTIEDVLGKVPVLDEGK